VTRTGTIFWTVVTAATAIVSCSDGGESNTPSADIGPAPDTVPPRTPGCETSDDCGDGQHCVDTVCLRVPTSTVVVTDNTLDEPADVSVLNVSCAAGQVEAPDGPEAATAYGIVDRFGGGRQTIGIEVGFFEQENWPPAECMELAVAEQRDCFRSIPSQWVAISTDPTEGNSEVPDTCQAHLDCPLGYDCVEGDLDYHCAPQHGLYEITSVPTNTWLVVRSRNTIPIYEKKWKDTYIYGVYLYADRVDTDGRYRTNAMMVSDGQWVTVPNTLLVPGIKKMNGALGGRVRDCRTDSRDSFTLGNASIGLKVPGAAIGYFNDDEENTVPLLESTGTDVYGRFTVVDIAPGLNRVAASILDGDNNVVSLGSEEIVIVPDSLTIVSFPGKQAILGK
jgi:hypothetical protein